MTPAQPLVHADRASFRALLRLTSEQRIRLAVGALCALCTAVFTALQGLLLGPLLRLLAGGELSSHPLRLPFVSSLHAVTSRSWEPGRRAILLTLIATATGRAAFTILEAAVWASITERVALTLRRTLLRSVLYAPAASLDPLSPGVLATRLSHDVDEAARAAASVSAALLRDGVTVLVLAALAFALSPPLFALTALTWPLVALGLRASARRQKSGARDAMGHRDRLAAWASALPASMQGIRLMNLRDFVTHEVDRAAKDHSIGERKRALSAALSSPLTELVAALGLLATLSALGPLRPESLDRTVGFFYVIFMAYRPLKGLGTLQVTAASGAQALAAITALPPPPLHTPEPCAPSELRAHDLRVMRGDRAVALHKTLHATPGTLTALTGASGVGKTSLLDALTGHRMSSGTLLFDGTPLHGRELRAGFTSQESPLLPTSLGANLCAAPASLDRARELLGALGLRPWLERLPDGFSTLLAADGVTPSVGERKRLGVARALLFSSPVVLLDEPTAGLDAESAALVRALLRAEADRGRTVLVVTHDPALAALCERVIDLEPV